jgi:AraC family transcriptional regulator
MPDYINELTTLQFYPRLLLLSNYHANYEWSREGIYASYHQQPAWEMPEFCGPFHTISINVTQQEILLERVLGGRRKVQHSVFNDDVTIIPAHVTNQVRWDRDVGFMMLLLDPDSIAQVAYESIDPDSVELLPHFDASDPVLHQIGLSFKAELESGQRWNRLAIDSLKNILSITLLRKYATHKAMIREYGDGLSKQKLKQVVDYIHDSLAKNLSLQDIADEVKMSACYLSTLFKRSTGLTRTQKILSDKERAQLQKKTPDQSLETLCGKC